MIFLAIIIYLRYSIYYNFSNYWNNSNFTKLWYHYHSITFGY